MFKTVKKLKCLKVHLKKLAWKNGNVFENVINLREQVKEVQRKIDIDPENKELRKEECEVLKRYMEAMKDEEKLLFQKAKVNWLSMGTETMHFFISQLKVEDKGIGLRPLMMNKETGLKVWRLLSNL